MADLSVTAKPFLSLCCIQTIRRNPLIHRRFSPVTACPQAFPHLCRYSCPSTTSPRRTSRILDFSVGCAPSWSVAACQKVSLTRCSRQEKRRPSRENCCQIGENNPEVKFDLCSIRGCAPEIEVFNGTLDKTHFYQVLVKTSPKWRRQQVQRISARRDRFRASYRGGRCSAPPA